MPAVEVSFEQSGYSVTEGSGVIVKVKLNADPGARQSSSRSGGRTREASDSDYRGVPTSVTFDSGDTEKSFTFTADR